MNRINLKPHSTKELIVFRIRKTILDRIDRPEGKHTRDSNKKKTVLINSSKINLNNEEERFKVKEEDIEDENEDEIDDIFDESDYNKSYDEEKYFDVNEENKNNKQSEVTFRSKSRKSRKSNKNQRKSNMSNSKKKQEDKLKELKLRSNMNVKTIRLSLEDDTFRKDKEMIVNRLKELADKEILMKKNLKDFEKERSIEDLKSICEFLYSSKISNKLRHDGLSNENFLRILGSLSSFVRFKYISQGNYIFYQGDRSEKFYIILKGEIGIYQDVIKEDKMTVDQYFTYLLNLNPKYEKQLIEKTIKENSSTFPIDLKDIKRLPLLYSFLKYKQHLIELLDKILLRSSLEFIVEMIEKISLVYENIKESHSHSKFIDYTLKERVFNRRIQIENIKDENEESEKEKEKENKHKQSYITTDKEGIYENLINIIRQDLKDIETRCTNLSYYKFFYVMTQPERVSIINRLQLKKLQQGDYFGDIGLELLKGRTASVKALSDLYILSITSLIYKEYIIAESNKITNKLINVLLEKYFLSSMPRTHFLMKYFFYFRYATYEKGHVFGVKGEEQNVIFLLLSGKVACHLPMSMIELNDYYKKYLSLIYENLSLLKINNKQTSALKDKVTELFVNEDMLPKDFYTASKYDVINNKKDMKDKKNIKVFTMENISIIGGEEFLYKTPFSKTYIAESNITLFEIENINLQKLMKEEECRNDLVVYIFQKSILFLQGMNTLRMNHMTSQRKNFLKGDFLKSIPKVNSSLKINALVTNEKVVDDYKRGGGLGLKGKSNFKNGNYEFEADTEASAQQKTILRSDIKNGIGKARNDDYLLTDPNEYEIKKRLSLKENDNIESKFNSPIKNYNSSPKRYQIGVNDNNNTRYLLSCKNKSAAEKKTFTNIEYDYESVLITKLNKDLINLKNKEHSKIVSEHKKDIPNGENNNQNKVFPQIPTSNMILPGINEKKLVSPINFSHSYGISSFLNGKNCISLKKSPMKHEEKTIRLIKKNKENEFSKDNIIKEDVSKYFMIKKVNDLNDK